MLTLICLSVCCQTDVALNPRAQVIASRSRPPESAHNQYVSDSEMDAMDASDNFHLPKPHALSTSLLIHDAFRECVSRLPLVCAVCDEMQFLKPHNSISKFGPCGTARWHHMTGEQLIQYREVLSQKPGLPPLPTAVVSHYQLHSTVCVLFCYR